MLLELGASECCHRFFDSSETSTCGEDKKSAKLARLLKASHDQPCGRNSETTVPLPSWSCSCGRRSLCQDRRLQVLGYGLGTAKFETVSLRSSEGFSTLQSRSDFFKFFPVTESIESICDMCSGIRSQRLHVKDLTPEPQLFFSVGTMQFHTLPESHDIRSGQQGWISYASQRRSQFSKLCFSSSIWGFWDCLVFELWTVQIGMMRCWLHLRFRWFGHVGRNLFTHNICSYSFSSKHCTQPISTQHSFFSQNSVSSVWVRRSTWAENGKKRFRFKKWRRMMKKQNVKKWNFKATDWDILKSWFVLLDSLFSFFSNRNKRNRCVAFRQDMPEAKSQVKNPVQLGVQAFQNPTQFRYWKSGFTTFGPLMELIWTDPFLTFDMWQQLVMLLWPALFSFDISVCSPGLMCFPVQSWDRETHGPR